MKDKLYIFGYSGHAYVVIDAALSMNFSAQGYFDLKPANKNPYQLDYIGNENEFDFQPMNPEAIYFPAMGSNSIRQKIIQLIESKSLHLATIIHQQSIISKLASIEVGTLVGPGAIINSNAEIGKGTIINSGAIVEHECEIGAFSHLAPGCVLAGNVKIGRNCFIGANSIIKEGISIGDNAIVGAGAVVLKNISNNETWVGNPAKRIKY